MSFIDLVEWQNMNPDVFAWKYPARNLSTATQLLVHESQEAVLFSKGEIIGKFGPGKHTLNTENLPVVSKLFGIPFGGGRNPFTAEVWFVNMRAPLNIDWKISKMMINDPEFKFVPLVARGRYGLKIASAEKFLVKLVGNVPSFNARQITDHFSGLIEQYTKNAIISEISSNSIPVTRIGSSLNEIANAVKLQMNVFWDEYGFSLPGFFITDISIDESDPTGKTIMEAIAKSSAQSIAGYTWQQAEAMKVANNAVSGASGDMGILGMAMLTGSFGGGGFANNLMQPPQQSVQQNNPIPGQPAMAKRPGRKTVFCSNCGKSYPATSKFCPHCGDPYNPCPVCGADNTLSAKRCVSCGTALPQKQDMMEDLGYGCPNCGAPIGIGMKFCPNCGKKLE